MAKLAEQLDKTWRHAKGKHKNNRWYLEFWRKRAERRDLKKNLEGAEKRHTKGWEY
jgi:hypothetical protein